MDFSPGSIGGLLQEFVADFGADVVEMQSGWNARQSNNNLI
jgi:hypothetical protein